MLTADYQEFANWANTRDPWQYRDLHRPGEPRSRNQPGVARLPRCQTSTKPELPARTWH